MKIEIPTKAVVLLITYDCNLKCSYCYEPKLAHRKMDIETAKKAILKSMGTLDNDHPGMVIQFMGGGEPLMHFDLIKDVTEWIWSLDNRPEHIVVQAPTNGTLLNDDMKEWLINNKEKFHLALSFDGDRLMQNINRCGSYSNVDLAFFSQTYLDVPVKMTISPKTISSFYDGYIYLKEKGFNIIEPSLAIGAEIGWTRNHLQILKQELDKFVNYFTSNPDSVRAGDLNIPVWEVLDTSLPDRYCRVGPDIVCYDYNGEEYPCHILSPITIGKKDADFAKSIDFRPLRKKITPCKSCFLNKTCVRCYGINYRDRGDFTTPSPFDCAQYKLFFYANCKIELILAQRNGDRKMEEAIKTIIKLLKH